MRLSRADQKALRKALKMELCRRDLWQTCLHVDPEFFEKRPFLKEVADAFTWLKDEYVAGRARKIAISMAPRAGKSYVTTIACVWWLGNFPELSVMRNTCTARLYDKFSYDVRALIRKPVIAEIFGRAVALAPDKQNLDGWNLARARQVSYFGAGVGGAVIGFGANLAISDDLYVDIRAALSVAVREGTAMWKESAHDSRKELNCPEVFIGTRWTKNDEIGKAIESGEVDRVVKIPALLDVVRDKRNKIVSGRSFCEHVKSTAEYMKLAATNDPMIFEAEYMQEPVEMKGLLFPASELSYFKPEHIDGFKPDYQYLCVDPADEGRDFLAAPGVKLYGNCMYVYKVMYNQDGTDKTIADITEWLCDRRELTNFVNIEGNGGWMQFAKDMRRIVGKRRKAVEFRAIVSTQNKDTRILAQAAFIKMYFRFLEPEYQDAEYKAFMKHLTEFLRDSGGKQQDGPPDSLVIATNFFRDKFPSLW